MLGFIFPNKIIVNDSTQGKFQGLIAYLDILSLNLTKIKSRHTFYTNLSYSLGLLRFDKYFYNNSSMPNISLNYSYRFKKWCPSLFLRYNYDLSSESWTSKPLGGTKVNELKTFNQSGVIFGLSISYQTSKEKKS